MDDGRLLTVVEDTAADTRRLAIDGRTISPAGLHVSAVRHVGDGAAMVLGTTDDPTCRHVYAVAVPELSDSPGLAEAEHSTVRTLSLAPGVHDAVVGGDVVVSVATAIDVVGTGMQVRSPAGVVDLATHAMPPPLAPAVRIVRGGEHDLRVGIVLPREHRPGTKLPVLMDPYGGPHHAEVLAAQAMWLSSQWFADQGFAVVVCDGRGTPGRGLAWEKAVAGDLATAPLADQVEALAVAAEHEPDLDLERVAIRGWSFGGYLAALAVAAPAGHLPRRDRRSAGDGPDAVRHRLHRAVSGHRPGRFGRVRLRPFVR